MFENKALPEPLLTCPHPGGLLRYRADQSMKPFNSATASRRNHGLIFLCFIGP